MNVDEMMQRSRSGLLVGLAVVVGATMSSNVAEGQQRGMLGVGLAPHPNGVQVVQVLPGSPATRVVDTQTGIAVSLEPGDVIVGVGGRGGLTPPVFARLIREGPPIALLHVWDVRYNVMRLVRAFLEPEGFTSYAPAMPAMPTYSDGGAARAAAREARERAREQRERETRIKICQNQCDISWIQCGKAASFCSFADSSCRSRISQDCSSSRSSCKAGCN